MPKSSRLSLFPDINVWVALSYERHVHHLIARRWFEGLPSTARLFFCRLTQLGLLRLLTSEPVMGADGVRTQQEAWEVYDYWSADERVEFLDEPTTLESEFRELTRSPRASQKEWGDGYVTAFARAARLTIVTFDRGFQSKTEDLMILESS